MHIFRNAHPIFFDTLLYLMNHTPKTPLDGWEVFLNSIIATYKFNKNNSIHLGLKSLLGGNRASKVGNGVRGEA